MQNQIPNNWQKVKLEEIVAVSGGGTPSTKESSYWKGDIAWLTPAEITNYNNRFIAGTASYITQSGLNNSSAKIMPQESILLTSRATIGNVVFNSVPMATNQGFINIEPVKVNKLFFYYWLKYKKKYLNQIAVGSTFPELTKSVFKKIETNIPQDIKEQEKIGKFLSSFDDKIELNNKIAKTIEEMADTLFKEWFVKFRFTGWEKTEFVDSELGKIPKGWEVIKLEKILKLKHGYAFKGNKFINEKTNNIVVRMGNFQENNGLQFLNNTVYLKNIDSQNKYLLNPGDIVMILSDITREGRLIGNVGIIPNDAKSYFLNQRVAKIETDKKYILYLLNLFTSKEFHQHCLSRADSATVLNLKNEHIHDYEIALPENNIFKKFDELIEPIMNKKKHIKYENQKLVEMRDLLLPKLMKGEIRV